MRIAIITLLLLSARPSDAQRFGGAVAATADKVFVGETGNMDFVSEVYVYSRARDWTESGRLRGSAEADRFGRALAVHGDLLLVGASAANASAGAVYVFRRGDAGAWVQATVFAAPDAAEDDQFGSSIAFDGTIALISALGKNDGAGTVYVFERDETEFFAYSAVITEEPAQGFGSVLVLQDGVALIGSPAFDENRGRVSVYVRQSDSFRRIGVLEPDSTREGGRFGSALALGDGLAFVGMPMAAQRQGMVRIYDLDEAEPVEVHPPLKPIEPQRGAMFGASLVFADDMLWVGSPGENQRGGVVYRFERRADSWGAAQRQASTLATGAASFGNTLSVAQDVAVVGATGVDRREGAAVILALGDEWEEQRMVVSDIRSFEPVMGGEVPCAEGQAGRWACDGIDLIAFVPTHKMGGVRGTISNDIWGWTDPETGRDYALVGRSDGTAFVDVTDPETPVYVGDLPMTKGSRPNVWRDIKVYKDHAYVVADGAGEHGMQVFDLTQLRAITDMPATFTETALYDGVHSAHNVVINEDTGFAFVVGASGGGETCGGGLHMINIQDPAAPAFAGCFADVSTGRRKTGYAHDAQCVIYHGPDVRYQGREICVGSNETALSIADVTDKEKPVSLAMTVYPKVAYAHQGWLTEDHAYFYMNDEGDEPQHLVAGTRTLIWDVTDLEDPMLVREYIAKTTATDHNLYIKDSLMYQSNYGSGLRILDISVPDNPVEIGHFDTTPSDAGSGGSWSNYPYFKSGVIIVTSMEEGLFVLKQAAAGT